MAAPGNKPSLRTKEIKQSTKHSRRSNAKSYSVLNAGLHTNSDQHISYNESNATLYNISTARVITRYDPREAPYESNKSSENRGNASAASL
jgi:hypothetical protein